MVAMEPMTALYAAHADHAAPVTDGTSLESERANATSAATDMASAEATTTEATTTEAAAHATATTAAAPTTTAAAPTTAPTTAMTTFHQHQQAAACIHIGVTGIARLRERCRGRKSNRKSADDTKREDAAFHDCTSRGHLHDKFIATSSIDDRSVAIGVFPEEHASGQPPVSQAETASAPSTSLARRERESPTLAFSAAHRQRRAERTLACGTLGLSKEPTARDDLLVFGARSSRKSSIRPKISHVGWSWLATLVDKCTGRSKSVVNLVGWHDTMIFSTRSKQMGSSFFKSPLLAGADPRHIAPADCLFS